VSKERATAAPDSIGPQIEPFPCLIRDAVVLPHGLRGNAQRLRASRVTHRLAQQACASGLVA